MSNTIQSVSVLNTITDNGGDVIVSPRGVVSITGAAGPIYANNITGIMKIPSATEQLKKQKITLTAANSTAYVFSIFGYSTASQVGYPQPISNVVTTTSAANCTTGANIDTLVDTIVAIINAWSNSNVTATAGSTGTGIITLLAEAGWPDFTVQIGSGYSSIIAAQALLTASVAAPAAGGETATIIPVVTAGNIASYVITNQGYNYLSAPTITLAGGGWVDDSATAVINVGKVVSITNVAYDDTILSYPGIQAAGTVALLQAEYSSWPSIDNLTSGSTYTEWQIDYTIPSPPGSPNMSSPTMTATAIILVKDGATNFPTLSADWGVLAQLKEGYRVVMYASSANLDGSTTSTISTMTHATGTTGFVLDNVAAGDILAIAASLTQWGLCLQPYTDGTTTANFVFTSALVWENTLGALDAGAGKIVKRYPLTL